MCNENHAGIFVVIDSRSFVAVAEMQDTSTAAISRQVSGLKGYLGARLLNRTTRRISLTESGRNIIPEHKVFLTICPRRKQHNDISKLITIVSVYTIIKTTEI